MRKKPQDKHRYETSSDVFDALNMARRSLAILERQAAGFTTLSIPAHLQIELEEKRREVTELETQEPQTPQEDNITETHNIPHTMINIIGDGNIVGDENAARIEKPANLKPVAAGSRNSPQQGAASTPIIPSPSLDTASENPWFGNVGLIGNPFRHLTAEEDEDLPRYQVQPQVLRLIEGALRGNDDISRYAIFGDKGCGKTALHQRIAASRYPTNVQDKVLCVGYEAETLNAVLTHADYSLDSLESIHYVKVMRELVQDTLQNGKFPYVPDASARQAVNTLTQLISQQGFQYLLCLVDQVDAVEIVEAQPEKMASFLKPLMRLSHQNLPGIGFRYFLPSSLEPLMQEKQDVFRLDRYRIVHLVWTEEDLELLIAQRLSAFSKNPLNPITSLGQLCEPEDHFSASIDHELVCLAEKSPRATVWLANHLIQLHCQQTQPPRVIQAITWKRVRADWWSWGRNQLFGPLTQSEGYVLAGERIYFQGEEITLSEKYDALLRCLIQAGGGICTKEELIRAGWPGDKPEGVTKAALTEAMRRMKTELEKLGYNSRWVTTVRGRGYRLQKPKDTKRTTTNATSEGGA